MFRLDDLACVRTGLTSRCALQPVADGNLFLFQLKDAHAGLDFVSRPPVRVRVEKLPQLHLLSAGDLLFRTRGAQHLLLPLPDLKLPMACVAPLAAVRIFDQTQLLPAYLAWYVNDALTQQELAASPHRSGRLQLRSRALQELRIPLPLPAVQRQIVDLHTLAHDSCAHDIRLVQERLRQTTQQLRDYAVESHHA